MTISDHNTYRNVHTIIISSIILCPRINAVVVMVLTGINATLVYTTYQISPHQLITPIISTYAANSQTALLMYIAAKFARAHVLRRFSLGILAFKHDNNSNRGAARKLDMCLSLINTTFEIVGPLSSGMENK